MNKDNAKGFLPLVQALAEGKTIQYRKLSGEWMDIPTPAFHTNPELYRIKPEPRVIWAVICGDGIWVDATDSEKTSALYASAYPGGRVVKFVESQD